MFNHHSPIMRFIALCSFFCITLSGYSLVNAQIVFETAQYHDSTQQYQGQLVYDKSKTTPSPAILMGPTWTGPGEYTKMRAQALAQLGFVVLVADIYGQGYQPSRGKESAQAMDAYMKDRNKLRQRIQLAYETLKHRPNVDPQKIVALGYCFGGTAVLELARNAAELAGVVVFHGILNTPTPKDAQNIKSSLLVLNGADDPNVPDADVQNFWSEMRQAHVDLQFINYSETKHAFTDPSSGTDTSKGSFYNPVSDKRSWIALLQYLNELNLTTSRAASIAP
jgi:dienelactone hydrolase